MKDKELRKFVGMEEGGRSDYSIEERIDRLANLLCALTETLGYGFTITKQHGFHTEIYPLKKKS